MTIIIIGDVAIIRILFDLALRGGEVAALDLNAVVRGRTADMTTSRGCLRRLLRK